MTVKKAIRKMSKKKKKNKPPTHYLSTGSTLLNLAVSNRHDGGFGAGRYYFMVGDSSSGKTFISLTCFAEACADPFFANHRIIHDDVEDGALMDLERYFGQAVVDRIEPPATDKEGPKHSETIEDFYDSLTDAIDDGRPFIYVLDSMDCLTSIAEKKKDDESKKARRMKKESKGSYGDGKAKKNSASLRKVMKPLKKTDSILIILNQTRDNIDSFSFEKKTRSGGRALKFYACVEVWSSVAGKLKKTVRGIARQVGIDVKIKVKKNRQTGGEYEIQLPIYHSFGIDDVGSCVDYLIKEKHWTKSNQTIKCADFDCEGTRDKVISYIEDNSLEADLREVVGDVWGAVIKDSAISRKKRYK